MKRTKDSPTFFEMLEPRLLASAVATPTPPKGGTTSTLAAIFAARFERTIEQQSPAQRLPAWMYTEFAQRGASR
jgi:hypothetical protein